jgi:hypothetical protein
MGGNVSKTESSATVNSIAETAMKLSAQSIVNCTTNVSQSQKQRIRGPIVVSGGGTVDISQSASMNINQNCTQKAQVNNDMQIAVVNAIKQEAETKGVDFSLLAGDNISSTVTNIKNNISADINMDNIMNSITKMQQTQKQVIDSSISVTGAGSKFVMSQGITADMFLSQLSDTIKTNAVVANVANQIDQKASTEVQSTAVGLMNSLWSGLTSLWGMLIIGAIIIICVGAYVMFGGSGGAERKNQMMQKMMQKMDGKSK